MKNHISKALLLLLFFIFFAPELLSAQSVYGKIYTKEEADELYGPVLKSLDINAAVVRALLNRAGDYIMFNYDTDSLYILDGKRNILFPNGRGRKIDPSEVFRVFSVSVVRDLLGRGNEDKVHIEKRKDVLSVTYSTNTMEMSMGCPPECGY